MLQLGFLELLLLFVLLLNISAVLLIAHALVSFVCVSFVLFGVCAEALALYTQFLLAVAKAMPADAQLPRARPSSRQVPTSAAVEELTRAHALTREQSARATTEPERGWRQNAWAKMLRQTVGQRAEAGP